VEWEPRRREGAKTDAKECGMGKAVGMEVEVEGEVGVGEVGDVVGKVGGHTAR
jgi:hypothetical protein